MNYYNEWDSFAAEWLKQLIKDNLIPPGEVDSRSIADVEPEDLKGFTQCHFFAGIGGWSRALQIAGWSSDRPVWTGSPPCQSFSTAGKGKGKDDERHLWPVFFNLIRECQPPTVFGEQVASAIRFGWLDDLQIDFEKEGYASGAFVLSAGSIGAPHKRDRLFFVADSQSKRGYRGLRSIHQENEEQQTRKEQGQDRTSKRIDGGSTDFVADSHNERHERSSEDGRQAQRGVEHAGSLGVAYSEPERLQGRLQGRKNQERQGISGHSGRSGATNSVGNANSDRPEQGDEAAETARYGDTPDAAGIRAEFLDNSNARRYNTKEEKIRAGRELTIVPELTSFWSESEVIYCRDGKFRPIPTQPALFPLAIGLPNRVGLLRGAGNAIVPQAAAEIIKAVM